VKSSTWFLGIAISNSENQSGGKSYINPLAPQKIDEEFALRKLIPHRTWCRFTGWDYPNDESTALSALFPHDGALLLGLFGGAPGFFSYLSFLGATRPHEVFGSAQPSKSRRQRGPILADFRCRTKFAGPSTGLDIAGQFFELLGIRPVVWLQRSRNLEAPIDFERNQHFHFAADLLAFAGAGHWASPRCRIALITPFSRDQDLSCWLLLIPTFGTNRVVRQLWRHRQYFCF